MTSQGNFPYRGEMSNGFVASVSPGLAIDPLSYLRRDSTYRLAVLGGLAMALFAGHLVWAGSALWKVGGVAASVGGIAMIVLGSLVGLIALALAAIGVISYSIDASFYKNGLLAPGIVINEDPPEFAVLAEMSLSVSGTPANRFGVRRFRPKDSPPAFAKVLGARVPCVAALVYWSDEKGRFAWFDPKPIYVADASERAAEKCQQRLGDEIYAALEAFIAAGQVPADESTILLFDEDSEFLQIIPKEDAKPVSSA